ncbi:hypothetical protein OPV22_020142 [Ensete ventricosum]|uniref:Cytochrome b561 domain-containing protein n=1 Tax=Ensete ventricosum TaxID=4639 RepID=A0AAV8QFP5_ENSVE|nr:hypothetical protein OPV22_020142 [Ensete ventricosum]
MMLGWGVLIPIGIVVARYFKNSDPLWFFSHLSIQRAWVPTGPGRGHTWVRPRRRRHQRRGRARWPRHCHSGRWLPSVDRPGKASKVRKHWNRYHHYAGRAAVVCAVANIFYGFTIFMEISRCASEE